MKILRGFMRSGLPSVDVWSLRMDALLCAAEADLVELICDGILALSIKSGKSTDDVVDFFRELNGVTGSDSAHEVVQNRWDQIISTLGEHMPEQEVKERLAEMSKYAPWE